MGCLKKELEARYRNFWKISRDLYSVFKVFLCLCGLYFEAAYSPVLEQKKWLRLKISTDSAANFRPLRQCVWASNQSWALVRSTLAGATVTLFQSAAYIPVRFILRFTNTKCSFWGVIIGNHPLQNISYGIVQCIFFMKHPRLVLSIVHLLHILLHTILVRSVHLYIFLCNVFPLNVSTQANIPINLAQLYQHISHWIHQTLHV